MKKVLITLLLLIGCMPVLQAQESYWKETQEILPEGRFPGVGLGSIFGSAIAIDGDYALIGDPGYDAPTEENPDIRDVDAGGVFVYERDNNGIWHQVQVLTPSTYGVNFGSSVAIDGNYAIVGARGDGLKKKGSAVIFERSENGEWKPVHYIAPDNYNNRLATSVEISGDYAFVGDPDYSAYAKDWGEIRIYHRNAQGEWEPRQRIPYTPIITNGIVDDKVGFGYSMSASGEYLLVGAEDFEIAFMLKRQSNGDYQIPQWLYPTVSAEGFGCSVAIDGSYALIGKESIDGEVYVLELQSDGTWIGSSIIPSPVEYIRFGLSVALSGDKALISGTSWSQELPLGTAYIYRRDINGAWVLEQRVTPTDSIEGSYVGFYSLRSTVAISDNTALVGAVTFDTGSVYNYAFWSTTSVVEQNLDTPVSWYPNPFQKRLNVELGQQYPEIHLTVRNVVGQVLYTKTSTATDHLQVDVEGPAGIYFVEIRAADNRRAVLKVVKD